MSHSTALIVGTPKVSVCIPVHNGAMYIQGAVDSALDQDYPDFEIVIVDNCSTDGTAALVEKISSNNEKVRFFKNDRNIGLAANLNKCIEYASGEYIKYLLVDDLFFPGCIRQMAEGLDNHPQVSLVCGARLSIDASGASFTVRRYSSRKMVVSGHEVISRCLFGGNFIGEPTAVMFRKSDLQVHFREDLPQLMDMVMWFNLLERGDLWSIDIPICSIRIHDAQMTRANIRSGKLIEDNVRVFSEFSGKPYLNVRPWMRLHHKLLMTYRIWFSRQFLSPKYRQDVLRQFGFRWLFFIMPIIYLTLVIARKLARFRSMFFPGSPSRETTK